MPMCSLGPIPECIITVLYTEKRRVMYKLRKKSGGAERGQEKRRRQCRVVTRCVESRVIKAACRRRRSAMRLVFADNVTYERKRERELTAAYYRGMRVYWVAIIIIISARAVYTHTRWNPDFYGIPISRKFRNIAADRSRGHPMIDATKYLDVWEKILRLRYISTSYMCILLTFAQKNFKAVKKVSCCIEIN